MVDRQTHSDYKAASAKFHSGEGIVLYATVDASYASHADFKSHTGCTLHIGRLSASFLTLSKKQTINADSSTYAEFIAAHTATKQILGARCDDNLPNIEYNFLLELGFPQLHPTSLFEDNMSTIQIVNQPGNNGRTKHIALRYNVIREQVERQIITLQHLSGIDILIYSRRH